MRAASTLSQISQTHVAMKEAFARYEDGIPFFRDLKVLEIMEDMQILEGIDKDINANRQSLPPIFLTKIRKRSRKAN